MIAFSQVLNFDLLCLIEIIKGCLLYVKFKSNDRIYHVINIYASPENCEKMYIFYTLSTFLDDLHTSKKNLCGDFNVTLDSPLDRSGDCEPLSAALKRITTTFLEYSLVDSFRKTNGNEIIFTWGRENSHSRLDRVYVSSHISNRLVYSSIVHYPYSKHYALCTVIMTSKVNEQSWHFNVSLLNDKIYVNIIIIFEGK